jgi:hypothetical protein
LNRDTDPIDSIGSIMGFVTGPPLSPIEIEDDLSGGGRRHKRLVVGVVGLVVALMSLGTALALVLTPGTAAPAPLTPLPTGPNAPASLCTAFFGTSRAIAYEFGAPPSLAFGSETSGGVQSGDGWLECGYGLPPRSKSGLPAGGLTLTVGSGNGLGGSNPCGVIEADAHDQTTYAAEIGWSCGEVHVSQANEPGLKVVAMKAELPGCRSRAPCSRPEP